MCSISMEKKIYEVLCSRRQPYLHFVAVHSEITTVLQVQDWVLATWR